MTWPDQQPAYDYRGGLDGALDANAITLLNE